MKPAKSQKKKDSADLRQGVVESEVFKAPSQVSMTGQLGHRTSDPLIKDSDSDFPEPGGSPEHTGEPQANREEE